MTNVIPFERPTTPKTQPGDPLDGIAFGALLTLAGPVVMGLGAMVLTVSTIHLVRSLLRPPRWNG